jgi:alpha-acetolactate decarboxylase
LHTLSGIAVILLDRKIFEDSESSLTATNTHPDTKVTNTTENSLVERISGVSSASTTERVANRNSPTVNVDNLRVEIEGTLDGKPLCSKRLIKTEESNVGD